MDLSNKNGQPSMEEILASIRRIIAEEPTAANPVIDLHARHRNKPDDHEESNDFELPSIFRPAAPTPERQPLFGRLTDAIRNASVGSSVDGKGQRKTESDPVEAPERYRGALRDAGTILAVANGHGSLDAAGGDTQDRYRGALRDAGGASSLSSALSSLKLTRGADVSPLASRPEAEVLQAPTAPAAPMSAPATASPTLVQSASPVDDVRRVMVPFRDMRMARMASPESASPTASESSSAMEALLSNTPSPQISPLDFPAPPQDLSQAFQAPPIPAPHALLDEGLSLDDMHRFAAVVEPPMHRPPPPPVAAEASSSGIEDATADLLRPMLRQWLAENMPRMVEKALSIELAQSVKANRKFNGY